MKKIFTLALALMPLLGMNAQENEVTTAQAKAMYKDVSKTRVSVHDPSVVYDSASDYYYIFGTMRGVAKSKDMQNWTAVELGIESGLAGNTWNVGVPWKAGTNTNAVSKNAFLQSVRSRRAALTYPSPLSTLMHGRTHQLPTGTSPATCGHLTSSGTRRCRSGACTSA